MEKNMNINRAGIYDSKKVAFADREALDRQAKDVSREKLENIWIEDQIKKNKKPSFIGFIVCMAIMLVFLGGWICASFSAVATNMLGTMYCNDMHAGSLEDISGEFSGKIVLTCEKAAYTFNEDDERNYALYLGKLR